MRKMTSLLALLTLFVLAACGDDSGSPVNSAGPETGAGPNADNEAVNDGRGNQDGVGQDEPAGDPGATDSVTPPADMPAVEEPVDVSDSGAGVDPTDVEELGDGVDPPAVGEPGEDVDPVDVDVPGADPIGDGGVDVPAGEETPGSEDDGRDDVPVDAVDPSQVDLRPADLPTPTGDDPPLFGTFLDVSSFSTQYIFVGAAKDAIPALTNPIFVRPSQVTYLRGDDLVLGVVVDGIARAYPENIGWWHEIVNDQIGDRFISVTFCPLTGTGLGLAPKTDLASNLSWACRACSSTAI